MIRVLYTTYERFYVTVLHIPVSMNASPEEEGRSLAFGGQALIEGVMMRSGSHAVMCVRQPNGSISTHVETVNSLTKKNALLGLPLLRGIIMLFETMYFGMKSIFHSANVALEEEEEQFTWKEYLLVIVMVVIMSGFFMVVPFLLTNVLGLSGFWFNVAEAGIRLLFFGSYLYLVSRWGEFQRVLMYHGAEHKAINTYEAGEELTVENVARHSRLNPRCGTSFLFIVVLMSIAFFSLIPKVDFYTKILYRIILIPALGGVSYELLKLSAKYHDSPVMKIITIPGLAFQKLTTKEPEDDMLEVAIEALQEVVRLSKA